MIPTVMLDALWSMDPYKYGGYDSMSSLTFEEWWIERMHHSDYLSILIISLPGSRETL